MNGATALMIGQIPRPPLHLVRLLRADSPLRLRDLLPNGSVQREAIATPALTLLSLQER